jgi:hypothetical protein
MRSSREPRRYAKNGAFGGKVYKYKYDAAGNWVELTTYGLVMDSRGSQLRIEEISYQIIKRCPERTSGK